MSRSKLSLFQSRLNDFKKVVFIHSIYKYLIFISRAPHYSTNMANHSIYDKKDGWRFTCFTSFYGYFILSFIFNIEEQWLHKIERLEPINIFKFRELVDPDWSEDWARNLLNIF